MVMKRDAGGSFFAALLGRMEGDCGPFLDLNPRAEILVLGCDLGYLAGV
jgi:hypothetical protein